MKKLLFLFLFFSVSVFGQTPPGGYSGGNSSGSGGGGGASGTAAALNNSAWYLAIGSCNGAANCTALNADGHYVRDVTSNSTTTVTCPNSDCNFTSNDFLGRPRMKVGQTIWATTQGSAGAGNTPAFTFTTFVCPQTTVASFTAQSVVLNSACTANGTANVVLFWGDKDGTALHGLDATVGCRTVYPPNGGDDALILFDRGFLITSPACASSSGLTGALGVPAPALIGAGGAPQGSIFVMTPDFQWADCTASGNGVTGICIGNSTQALAYFTLWGTGLTAASRRKHIARSGDNWRWRQMERVRCADWNLSPIAICSFPNNRSFRQFPERGKYLLVDRQVAVISWPTCICNKLLEAALAEGWVKEPYIPEPPAKLDADLYGPRNKK